MRARQEFRDRPDAEVAVLDALVERPEDGMTVFELRAAVDADVDIDAIEAALAALQDDDLIRTERSEGTLHIRPAGRVVPDPEADADDHGSVLDAVRDRLGL